MTNTAGDFVSSEDYQTAQLTSLILDLLTFCVEHHTFHMKNYVIHNRLLSRVVVLFKSKHIFLVLGMFVHHCTMCNKKRFCLISTSFSCSISYFTSWTTCSSKRFYVITSLSSLYNHIFLVLGMFAHHWTTYNQYSALDWKSNPMNEWVYSFTKFHMLKIYENIKQ